MAAGKMGGVTLFILALIGTAYAIWTFYGAGQEATLWGLLLLMTAIPVWFGMRLSALWSSPTPAAPPASTSE
jgi:hypothetical protein